MSSTRMNEMGMGTPDVSERQLAPQEVNEVRRAYMHTAESSRVRTDDVPWADYLDTLRNAPTMASDTPNA